MLLLEGGVVVCIKNGPPQDPFFDTEDFFYEVLEDVDRTTNRS